VVCFAVDEQHYCWQHDDAQALAKKRVLLRVDLRSQLGMKEVVHFRVTVLKGDSGLRVAP
jgi:hypothetical protein